MRAYLAVLAIAAYFSAMAWPGLWSGFNHDDLMNTTFTLRDGWERILKGNLLFFSTEYRPLGALFYRSLYDTFGLNSFPFRVVGISCLAINIVQLYRLTRILTGSGEAGLYAATIITWHGNFAPLFFGSGNIYDVLAFLFYISALVYYTGVRRTRVLKAKDVAILALLQICGLNSKEFTATLPIVLAAYELIFHRPNESLLRWPLREGRGVLLSVIISAVYALGKVFGPESLTSQVAYRPRISLEAYFASAVVFLNDFTYQTTWGSIDKAAVLIVCLIALPLVLRNRTMLVAAALSLLGPLPVMLISPRGLASHYITVGGLAIWTAALLLDLRLRFVNLIRAKPWESVYLQSVMFVLLFGYVVKTHGKESAFQYDAFWKENRPIEEALASMRKHPEWFTTERRVLVASDPFENHEWGSVFSGILTAGRYDLPIFRLQNLDRKKDTERIDWCNTFLKWKDHDFVEVSRDEALR
ncbi:MAG: glycosyltransferase family 39 protein [Bryobacteraceae bacterium]|nr:glycosyltransferase family 39 protein [Bryobacteraceae bacterium]